MHSHLETHTPAPHAQTQMKHNSSPPVGGMVVGLVLGSHTGYLRQWRSVAVG